MTFLRSSRRLRCAALLAATLLVPSFASAESEAPAVSGILRAVTLQDYNTRIVLLGTMILGACCGLVGTHLFLRRRALLGDVVSHAAFPGVCVAFLIGEAFRPGEGKSLGGLMIGAGISALCGVACLEGIRRTRRLAEDAALAIVLSLFFGLGVTLLSIIQGLPTGSAAGLSEFIFGKPAGLLVSDVVLIGVLSALVLGVCGLLWKELIVVSFDTSFAQTQGWPIRSLDLLLVLLVTAVTVIGMQCVGLLLVVALLIIPPAAARFWTDRIDLLAVISGGLGAASAACGVVLSAAFPRLAAGAVIVLCSSAFFVLSLLGGRRRGVLRRWWNLRQSVLRAGRQDLLRSSFELVERKRSESGSSDDWTVPAWTYAELEAARHWGRGRLPGIWRRAVREGLIRPDAEGRFHLTVDGARQAQAAARQHRLWELYLIRFADRHPVDVDPDADVAEHMLDPLIVHELERLLDETEPNRQVIQSPHETASTSALRREVSP